MNTTQSTWFSNIKSFDEIFSQIDERKAWKHRRSSVITSWFRKGSDMACIEVQPTLKLFQMIGQKVIAVDFDTLSFETIDLMDGTSLIKATHTRLANSHDIAIIDTHTIPGFEWQKIGELGEY